MHPNTEDDGTKQCTRVAKSGVVTTENRSSRPGDCRRCGRRCVIYPYVCESRRIPPFAARRSPASTEAYGRVAPVEVAKKPPIVARQSTASTEVSNGRCWKSGRTRVESKRWQGANKRTFFAASRGSVRARSPTRNDSLPTATRSLRFLPESESRICRPSRVPMVVLCSSFDLEVQWRYCEYSMASYHI